MRTFLAISMLVAFCGPLLADEQRRLIVFPVDRSIVDVDNEFSQNNPFYKQRAGAFYEIKYVGPSAEALFRIAAVRPEQMPGTLDALRAFVYEWLDAYVRGNGAIDPADRNTCVARLDQRFDSLFDSGLQRKLYRVWRDDESNQLRFLMASQQGIQSTASEPSRSPEPAAEPLSSGNSSPPAP
ncbi:hypothetical protein [Novipirellula sp.]|uniref:hypothetical protein n=1 Tax=Novipirellula sp. TaxID=2795430 RepID=UPI00356AF22A